MGHPFYFFKLKSQPDFCIVPEPFFNLVRKIGLAWERKNSLGICFVVVELRLHCFIYFCESVQEEKVPACAKTS